MRGGGGRLDTFARTGAKLDELMTRPMSGAGAT
jgi:hypothetical protein